MDTNDKKIHYTLFIDECGDPNLEKFEKLFRYLLYVGS